MEAAPRALGQPPAGVGARRGGAGGAEPEPELEQEPVPREPANQQQWGECTIYAFTTVAQELLEVKYNTALDELDTRAALTRFCEAFAGVWPDAVGAKINALGEELKIKAAAPRAELYQLRISGAKVTGFERLCADAAERARLGAFSVAVIRTSAAGHGLHSVAAHARAGPQSVLAKNSWGGERPRYEVTPANYDSHYTFDVEIVKCWTSGNERTAVPPVTAGYTSILSENRNAAAEEELRRRRSAEARAATRRERALRARAEEQAAQHRREAKEAEAQIRQLQEQLRQLRLAFTHHGPEVRLSESGPHPSSPLAGCTSLCFRSSSLFGANLYQRFQRRSQILCKQMLWFLPVQFNIQ